MRGESNQSDDEMEVNEEGGNGKTSYSLRRKLKLKQRKLILNGNVRSDSGEPMSILANPEGGVLHQRR